MPNQSLGIHRLLQIKLSPVCSVISIPCSVKYEVANKRPVRYAAQQGEQVPQMHQGLENSFISSAFEPKPEQWHMGHPKKGDGARKDKFQSGPIIEIVCTCLGEKESHMAVPQVMVISGSQKMWGF